MSMEGMPEGGLYPPREAARLLDVSGSGLRRLADIYTEVHGELPRDDTTKGAGKARLWPAEAVERLQKARAMVESKRWPSIKDALEARLAALEASDKKAADAEAERLAYVAEMEAIHADLEKRNEALRGEIERQKNDKTSSEKKPWWKWWG